MKSYKLLPVIFSILLFSACAESSPNNTVEAGKYKEVAQCLTEKGVIMYGAYWCPHCLNQKEAFGEDVQYITYQECDPAGEGGDQKACLEAGVNQYPTWFFPGQGNLVGEYPIYIIAKQANCDEFLPEEDKVLLQEALDQRDQLKEENPETNTETNPEVVDTNKTDENIPDENVAPTTEPQTEEPTTNETNN